MGVRLASLVLARRRGVEDPVRSATVLSSGACPRVPASCREPSCSCSPRSIHDQTRRPKPPPAKALFAVKRAKSVPFPFVLDALEPLGPTTRPMFGCLAVYVEDRIVLALRDKPEPAHDNGVWLATFAEHHASLRGELPSLRSSRCSERG